MDNDEVLKVTTDYYNRFNEILISPVPNGIGEHQVSLMKKALDTGIRIDVDVDDWFGYANLPEDAIA
jgi:hypothetical protein